MPSVKEQVLERLSLIQDEPEEENLFFSFGEYAKQINSVIMDENTHTPFVIAIHGEWGSGKTSLILEIEKLVKKEIDEKSKSNWHHLRFDAWEYERVDVISALFQKIESEYKNSGGKVKEFGKSAAFFLADAALRKGVGMTWRETKDHFKEFVNEIPNIKKNIEDLTEDGRLIIFVDDLDRCHIDNVLDMLEAIKMFLTAKRVIFVVAIDMKKIERAWKLRYQTGDGSTEGREHIEKIFQLKLSLPPKEENEITKYVELIINDSLSNIEKELIIKGCPQNPRKIKRILNLVYFILKGLYDDNEFDKKVPLVILWSILTTSFPKLARIIKSDPNSLIQSSFICFNVGTFNVLKEKWSKIKIMKRDSSNAALNNSTINHSYTSTFTLDCLQYIIEENTEAFELLRIFALQQKIKVNDGEDPEKLWIKKYSEILPTFQEITNKGGMTGV